MSARMKNPAMIAPETMQARRTMTKTHNYVGKVIFEAWAPVTGVVLYVCAVPSMTKGATITNTGVVANTLTVFK